MLLSSVQNVRVVLGPFLWRIGLTRFSAIFARSSMDAIVIISLWMCACVTNLQTGS